jgi:hypothetical protein
MQVAKALGGYKVDRYMWMDSTWLTTTVPYGTGIDKMGCY